MASSAAHQSARNGNAADEGQKSTGNSDTGRQDLEAGGQAVSNPMEAAGNEIIIEQDDPPQAARSQINEETELHQAARQRANGAAIDLPNDPQFAETADLNGMPPLYLAVHLGDIGTAKELIKTYGSRLSYGGPDGQNVLHVAALRSKDLTDIILRWQGGLWNQVDNHGSTPLHFAASVGVKGVTDLLLQGDRSVAMMQADERGMFPIHIAASVGAMDAIRSLVKQDELSSELKKKELSSAICDLSQGGTLLHAAVENKRTDVVRYVCWEPGLERILNLQNKDGNTALHLAVKKRDQTIFSHLLGNRHVDFNLVNKKGYTPLDLANKIKIRHLHASPKNPTEWMIRALAHSGAHFSARRRDLAWSTKAIEDVQGTVAAQNRVGDHLARSAEEMQNVRGAVTPQHNREADLTRSTEATHYNPQGAGTIQHHERDLARSTESVLVASALIATLTFAAAVTVPGSYKTGGTPALGRSYGFKVFLVADILAFYCSVAATFSLAEYGNRGNVDPLVRCKYAQRAVWFFHVSLKSVIVAFALGVSMVMWDISLITTIIVAITTITLVLHGNEALAHDFRLMWVMYRRLGPSLSWKLYPATSSHLDWTSRRLQSFSATLIWNTIKLFWTYAFIFLVAYIAQLKQKSVN